MQASLTPIRSGSAALEAEVSRLSHLLNRTARHEQVRRASGIDLDRAAIVVLRSLDETGPIRLSDLAELLLLDRPHVTRQVQALERAGFCVATEDRSDKRARLVYLTASGTAAAQRVRHSSQEGVERALASWSQSDLFTLTRLLHLMTDAFRVDQSESAIKEHQ